MSYKVSSQPFSPYVGSFEYVIFKLSNEPTYVLYGAKLHEMSKRGHRGLQGRVDPNSANKDVVAQRTAAVYSVSFYSMADHIH